jgi:DNA replication protein DnaC
MPRGRSSDPANQERFYECCTIARAFAEKPEGWLVLVGPSGCGKTHLAAAIANHCLELGYPVSFHVVPDLLDHFRSTFGPNSAISYDELFEHVRNTPLLVLDDLGTQSSTPWAQEKLYQIINHRFNEQLPTVVTTNVPLEELDERLLTRLTEPNLSRVCVVEERTPPVFEQVGSLGAELLSRMTFETFDTRGLNANGEQQQNLEKVFRTARRFAESPEGWLIFMGSYGRGKTHLAAAIANYRLREGHPVFFAVVPDLLDHLRAAFSPDSSMTYDELFERVREAPLLILDDLGAQVSSPWAKEKLFQIINHRYNRRLPTVITTSCNLEELEGRLSSRMVDPRISNAFVIEAPDYRGGEPKVEEEAKSPARRGRRGR